LIYINRSLKYVNGRGKYIFQGKKYINQAAIYVNGRKKYIFRGEKYINQGEDQLRFLAARGERKATKEKAKRRLVLHLEGK